MRTNKTNKFKGNARPGARIMKYTVQLAPTAKDANEKITITKTKQRTFNKHNGRTLGEPVYECMNTPGYFAFMRKYAKKNNSMFR